MLTNYHKLSGSKPQMHHATDSVIGPSAQGLPSLWRLWGRMHFHVHSGCWQKAVPSRFRTEDLFTCWLSARGCLHSPSIPPHLQAHSCFQSLPPARESSLSLRAHVIPLIQWSHQQCLIIVTGSGHQGGTSLGGHFRNSAYLYFLLRRLLNATVLLSPNQERVIGSLLLLSRPDFI